MHNGRDSHADNKISPLDIAPERLASGRQSTKEKPFKKHVHTDRKVFLPKQRSLVVKNAQSEDRIDEKVGKNRTSAKANSRLFINMRSGEGLSIEDYVGGIQ